MINAMLFIPVNVECSINVHGPKGGTGHRGEVLWQAHLGLPGEQEDHRGLLRSFKPLSPQRLKVFWLVFSTFRPRNPRSTPPYATYTGVTSP